MRARRQDPPLVPVLQRHECPRCGDPFVCVYVVDEARAASLVGGGQGSGAVGCPTCKRLPRAVLARRRARGAAAGLAVGLLPSLVAGAVAGVAARSLLDSPAVHLVAAGLAMALSMAACWAAGAWLGARLRMSPGTAVPPRVFTPEAWDQRVAAAGSEAAVLTGHARRARRRNRLWEDEVNPLDYL